MPLVDLTMPLSPATPVFPGDPAIEVRLAADLERDGYVTHELRLGTHSGTHLDAPAHLSASGRSLADVPLEQFCGRGVLIDARDGLGPGAVEQAGVQPGDVALLWTGLSDDWQRPGYAERVPDLDLAAVRLLRDAGPSLVGVDAASVDAAPFPVHRLLLSADVLVLENLVGLAGLAGSRFTVTALPLAVALDGAPARVVARLR